MLTKKQLILLKPFQANIFKEHGFLELARLAHEKSHNALQLALAQFLKEKIVTEKRVGTSKLYKINLSNETSYDYLELIKYENLSPAIKYSIEALKTEIEKYTLFYSLVIFGSYVEGKQTKKSDLDVAVLIPDKAQEQNIKIAANLVSSKALIPIHTQIITYDEFFEMLTNKQSNLGKEIANKHRAVHNINIFYKTIKKAIEHGFQY